MTEAPNANDKPVTGTVGGANPQTGTSDAARGVGGHSKDAAHDKGTPAEKKQG
jgi:hypothetical protein